MKFFSSILVLILILTILLSVSLYSQNNGIIVGSVLDEVTEEPLIGANIIISGTSIGAASDREGNFRITRVPVGREITIVFSFLGYQSKQETITLDSEEPVNLVVVLRPDILTIGEEIVVTSQLLGQSAAINQQLSSNTIVNVVSQDRIRDLPDQNAAESIGRLPGVSLQRDAGEGSKVAIRGLSPRFSAITINGERIPSTDPEDRSVDLSMISSDILAGIELYKSLTPDKDADAIGGTVNFVVRKAPRGLQGDFRLQPGYNAHAEEYGQYRGSLSLSNRFLDQRLGMVVTGNVQRANRSSDLLDAGYIFEREQREGEERAIISVNNLNLNDRFEIRHRYGGSLALDYDLPGGSLLYNVFWSETDREEVRWRKRYRVGSGYVEHWLRDREIKTNMASHTLRGEHNFRWFELDWRGSFSQTNLHMPFSHDAQFREVGAFTNDLVDDKGPELIPLGAKNDLLNTTFLQAFLDEEWIKDRDVTLQTDVSVPFSLGATITGAIKTGLKYRDKSRDRDKVQDFTAPFAIDRIGRDNPGMFEVDRNQRVLITNFISDYNPTDILDGQYQFNVKLDRSLIDDFLRTFRDKYNPNELMDLEDYDASEKIGAGYLMAEVNLGPKIMLLGGFRVEDTQTRYKTTVGDVVSTDQGVFIVNPKDTTGGQQYTEIFPMMHVRFKPTRWFDIRLAATRSMSRPNYFNLVPWERVSHLENLLERGRADLLHTTAWNYDAYFSFYNYLGLFTIGGFYKELENIDYIRTSRVREPGPTLGYMLTQPENAEGMTIVHGYEIELQTNLRLLPSPFDGIVLYANYSRIHSETFIPLMRIGPRSPDPPFRPTIIDTVRVARMPGQAKHIANFSVGYEKGGFSGRISVIYQDETLEYIGSRAELDGYTSPYTRWDLILQQDIGYGFSLMFNINNLTNLPEEAFLGIEAFPTREEYFGWTADFGIRYRFR
jgi:TonB-dependent receptor